MVALKLSSFGGMIPAVDKTLLPQNHADLSQNTWIYSGALEGFYQAVELRSLTNPAAKKVFRVPLENNDRESISNSFWMEFSEIDTDVIKSPSVNDQFDRFYWAQENPTGATTNPPRYNTKARIIVSSAPFTLGVPAPTVAPGGSVAGGTVPVETRAYVYTWVTAYAEEGPPSPPFTLAGNANGTWNMTFTAPGGGVTANRNITATRIYRTTTGVTGATTYFLVAEIAVATLTYADTVATTAVVAAGALVSTFYEPPPTDLRGIISMPNGIIAGFRKNEIYFCEPYKPHAWPSPYALAVEGQIVGLGVIGQSLIVLTSGSPYSISGVNPASMAVSRMAFTEPCLSRGSIVSTPIGVAYASPNGLVVAVPGQVRVVTNALISKDKWQDKVNFLSPTVLRATAFNGGYYCWGTVNTGCFAAGAFAPDAFLFSDFTGAYLGAYIDMADQRVAYTKLYNALPMVNAYPDVWTGETFYIRNGKLYWLDVAATRTREPYLWRSKTFETPNQRSFGAMRVYFSAYTDSPMLGPQNFNAVQTLAAGQYGLIRVYADGVLKFTRELRASGDIFRLPSGFKATYWEVEVEARVKVRSVEIATTAKELGTV